MSKFMLFSVFVFGSISPAFGSFCPEGYEIACAPHAVCVEIAPAESGQENDLQDSSLQSEVKLLFLPNILKQASFKPMRIAHDGGVDPCGCHGDYKGRIHCH